MTSGQLIVAPDAGFGRVAHGAGLAFQSDKLTVNIVPPARRMGGRLHDLMAFDALVPGGCGGRDVGVANEALCAGSRRLLLMIQAEAFGVKIRLHIPAKRMASRQQLGSRFDVTGLAVRHSGLGWHVLGQIVARHTVHHLREAQILKALAERHRIVTGGAIQVVFVPGTEMGDMRELQVDKHAGDNVFRDHAPIGEPGILDLFGRMTAPAVFCTGVCGQSRRHALVRVTGGALGMAGKVCKNPVFVKAVAESTVSTEAGLGINSGACIHVLRMRELEHNGPLLQVQRERKKIIRSGGWKRRVTLGADPGVQIDFKRPLMAEQTLRVAGPREFHGAFCDWNVAGAAVQRQQRRVKLVDEKLWLLRLLSGRKRSTPNQ